ITDLARSGRIRVIGYDYKDEADEARRWLAQFGNPYALIIVDADGPAALDWGIYGAPETFLVDAGGMVRWEFAGPLTPEVVQEQLVPQLAAPHCGPGWPPCCGASRASSRRRSSRWSSAPPRRRRAFAPSPPSCAA